jgi:hypothetical protein
MKPSSESKPYDLDEHRHRFAVWAAARAAQRGFTGIAVLRKAIESCGVVGYLRSEDLDGIDRKGFNTRHLGWCRAILAQLADLGVDKSTFGRAAKLLAVYLKSAIVLGPAAGTAFAHIAHPPIDGILLRGLSRALPESEHASSWSAVRWTMLDELQYYELIEQLRNTLHPGEPFWMIERYWTVTSEVGGE